MVWRDEPKMQIERSYAEAQIESWAANFGVGDEANIDFKTGLVRLSTIIVLDWRWRVKVRH